MCHYCKKVGHIKDKCWQLHPELRLPHIVRAYVTRSQLGGASNPGSESILSTLDFQKIM